MAVEKTLTDNILKPKRRRSYAARLSIAALVLAGLGVIAVPFLRQSLRMPAIETSQTDEFQDPEAGNGFGRITADEPQAEIPIRAPEFDAGPLEAELAAQREALEAQNGRLAEDVATLQAQLAAMAAADPEAGRTAEMTEALQDLRTQSADLILQVQEQMTTELDQLDQDTQRRLAAERTARQEAEATADARDAAAQERAREIQQHQQELTDMITQLQRENLALSEQMQIGMTEALRDEAERDRLAEEDQARRTALAVRQAEAQALYEAQIRSESVIFDAGGGQDSPSISGENQALAVPEASQVSSASADATGRQFVRDAAGAVTVISAEVIGNPSHTVLQGTLIQASLETAVESSLPGQIVAVVNRPVWSFDQSRVVIPQGSRIYGSYGSDIALGQARLLVGWTRLVTPDGQSVELAAFGADDQGRSGLTGAVNTRFGLRFGSAALLSIIGAGASLAAPGPDGDAAAAITDSLAESFAQTTEAVIGQYATLPPIISVQPGASITVIVDRDLEFF
jgi:type IV secretion system protein VirB10